MLTRFRCGCSVLVYPAAAAPFGTRVMRREVACVVGSSLPTQLFRTTAAAATLFDVLCVGHPRSSDLRRSFTGLPVE